MVYKIDHLAFATTQFARDINLFSMFGYKPEFIETNAKNMLNAKAIMQKYSPEFNFSLLSSEGNISIEVLDYGHVTDGTLNNILPVFENLQADTLNKPDRQINIAEMKLSEARLDINNELCVLQQTTGQQKFHFNKIIIKTPDIESSISFYENFRYRAIRRNEDFAQLEFKPLFRQPPSYIYLVRQDCCDKLGLIDQKGFNKIAFITNSVKSEKELLDSKGYFTTEIDQLTANNKQLNIFFTYSPSGELIEFVNVQN